MSSSTYVGNPDIMIAGPPPPPPPPPPMSGQLPSMRINTTENTAAKKAQMVNNDIYEPPAAIQNAMLTKDKKPFTYTPGMGGKLDLSQIRSPRMARRVAKNANDEGIEGPPKLAVETKPSVAASTAANFLIQPQVAVPVFPSNVPTQAHVNRMPSSQLVNGTPSNVADKQAEPPKNVVTKIDTKAVPITTPESPNTPTQVTLFKAPTPWLQNKNKPQEELPEWAKRACINKAVGSGPSESDSVSPTAYVQVQQQSPQQHSETKQEQEQYPIPQCQQAKSQQLSRRSQQQRQNVVSATPQQINPQSHQHERVIPIRIEDRPSVFDVKCDSGHHQFKQQPPTLHHQQRWGQMPNQCMLDNQAQNRPQDQEQSQIRTTTLPRPEQSVGTTYIIPVVVKDNDKKTASPNAENNTIEKTRIMQQQNPNPIQQHDSGPVQSRSFRVLQKITDTDAINDVGTEQIRKLELSEDEKLLMNKFKEQVDHETYLHQEEDPRYRGAAIPSRAFRFLQNMTDSSDATVTCATPRNIQNVANKKQNRNSKLFEEKQANLPASEQQVQEPKKYMGSAIPSRSFRILQAMTAPESNTTQENRQADYIYQTENNLPGNQQGVFLPLQPVPFWYSEGWWGCYPMQCNAAISNEIANETDRPSFPFHAYPNGRTYIGSFYPVYNKNFTDAMTRVEVTDRENSSGEYTGYATVIYPQAGYNNNNVQPTSHVDENKCNYIHDRFTAADSFFAQSNKLDFVQNSTVNEAKSTVLSDNINHLDAQSNETYNPKSIGEESNSNREKNNCITTAMNIIDDEEDSISDNVVVTNNIDLSKKKTFGPYINVPNYTYVDTSDSSASSDSNDSSDSSDRDSTSSNNEQLLDSCQKNYSNDATFNNTSSSASDSDSYVAYSTCVNPYKKLEKAPRNFSLNENCTDVIAACSTSANADIDNARYRRSRDLSENRHTTSFQQDICRRIASERCNDENSTNDLDSYSDKSIGDHQSSHQDGRKDPAIDSAVSHPRLGVNHEDQIQPDPESCYCKEDVGDAFFEATDDPPDIENTMVSVSLPLRFRFSVSEDNEDITTVIVGDSTIKAEKSCDEHFSMTRDDVRVNFHVGNDTSVDFTIKAHLSDEARSIENVIPRVDFTLRRDPTGVGEINGEERRTGTETELVEMGHAECGIKHSAELASRDIDEDDVDAVYKLVATQDNLLSDEKCDAQIESACCESNAEGTAFGRIAEPKLTVLEYSSMRDDLQIVDAHETENLRRNCVTTCLTDDKYIDENFGRIENVKRPPKVQEDTDDEDSGVTSDISRLISEADTDSECTCSKNAKKYQRTQTHSRLFRLLNDDSILSGHPRTDPSRKEYLSLPLETNVSNYDDNYCSNYSSGLTSPEYSPVYEQSWRKFHEDASTTITGSSANVEIDRLASRQERIPSKDDPYFRIWKSPKLFGLREHNVVPSLAFKTLDSKIPSWAYKVNVLCPRIKSTKSVPQTLLARHNDETCDPSRMVPPIPTSCTNSKTNYC
ncbi:hypothetical protein EAG_09031 [Camponotus floridanus]|uniref:Uncharacterized protein n=1 Tax=Camponotus floridanus TaxID=104421 RepID=E2AH43_CAMFO|nr:hypothetical protein EAG_09031 [Camponotus floridanus]